MILHYFKIAFRGLFRYKWQHIVCILGLIIGFSAFVLGGYWWYWEHHFDDFHPNTRYIYGITTTGIALASDGSAIELDQLHKDDAIRMLEHIPEIEKYTQTVWTGLRITEEGNTKRIQGLSVDSAFFSMFYSAFLDGDYRNVPFDGSHIVLTERAAIQYFGRTDCAGEMIPGGNKKVAGVIRNYPSNSSFRFEFLSLSQTNLNNVGRSNFYVQLNRHANINDIRKKIENHQSIAQTRIPGEEKNWSFNMRTLPEIHLNCRPELKNRFRNIQLLAIAGLLGLLGSLMNHLALFVGQQQRQKRRNKTFRSMGASSLYLFRKSFLDLSLPLVFAIMVSFYLINILFPYYQSYTQWQGYGIYENYISKLGFSALLHTAVKWVGAVTVLFLSAGALLIAAQLMKFGRQTPLTLRRSLITCQVIIGSFFLFVSLSLYKQFDFAQNKDKGIRVENIIRIDTGIGSNFDHLAMKEGLMRCPYIEDVTFTTEPVITELGDYYGSYLTSLMIDDERYDDINVYVVETNFLEFFGIKMKEGEWLSDETNTVVNEALIQATAKENLLGQSIKMPGGERTVSGILCNYNYSTMQYPIMGIVFLLHDKKSIVSYAYTYIKTKPENRVIALEHVQKTLETQELANASEGSRFLALTDVMNRFNRPERTLSLIFGILSLACILVVSFGIYSLITLTIEQRRKEIAIRKMNGAEFADMLRLFFGEYLLLVALGNAFALTLGYYLMQRWFEAYAYHTRLDWQLFVAVFMTTSVIVFLSIVSKISSASKTNVSEALKYE